MRIIKLALVALLSLFTSLALISCGSDNSSGNNSNSGYRLANLMYTEPGAETNASFTYNSSGQLIEGQYNYSLSDRGIESSYTSTFTYNALDQRTQRIDSDGAKWLYTYNSSGQLVQTWRSSSDGNIETSSTTAFTYNTLDQLTQSVESNGDKRVYTYNGSGQLIETQYTPASADENPATTTYNFEVATCANHFIDPDNVFFTLPSHAICKK